MTQYLFALLLAASLTAAEFHVSPTGQATNAGTATAPWDLQTALKHPSAVKPGDTIWVHGGTYKEKFVSDLRGTAAKPIIVRAVTGERATLDGAYVGYGPDGVSSVLTLRWNSEFVWFWGLEITSSHPERFTSVSGSNAFMAHRGGAISFLNQGGPSGTGTKFINCILHDTANGYGPQNHTMSGNMELYGSLSYNHGWDAPDGGHGHGAYPQNTMQESSMNLEENIFFGSMGGNAVQYQASSGYTLHNGTIKGNVFTGRASRLFVGGNASKLNLTVEENYTWDAPTTIGADNSSSHTSFVNGKVRDNYLHLTSGSFTPHLKYWKSMEFTGNTVISEARACNTYEGQIRVEPTFSGSYAGYVLDNNRYFGPQGFYLGAYPGTCYSLSGFTAESGFDKSSTHSVALPTANTIVVRPNKYESGRANIVVYNWENKESVSADVSGAGLSAGEAFEVRDAFNYFATPVLNGTYRGGALRIPMTGLVAVQPIGSGYRAEFRMVHPAPAFGTFILQRAGSGEPVEPPPDPDPDPDPDPEPDPEPDLSALRVFLQELRDSLNRYLENTEGR